MKLKSYLRGLGLGMIVTTLILVLAFRARNKEMTDAEIIARAHDLGMVETSLYGSEDNNSKVTDADKKEESGEGKIDPEGSGTVKQQETTTKQTETTAEQPETTTKQPETTAKPQETTAKQPETTKAQETTKPAATEKETTVATAEKITILFEDISSADKASKLLFDAGIIQNVEEFNTYLSEQGLATKVGEGEFTFTKGMTFEEIAAIITRRK
ncbi:MAG: hypothetical protein PUF12_01455 [Thermoflexaceae bacterium]|nr:hypothetical protein [Thermoflexaceae bacterium]